MNKNHPPSLRLVLVARDGEEARGDALLDRWVEAFSEVAPSGIPTCMWLTGVDASHHQDTRHCTHTLRLNPLIDGYQRQPHKRMTWSPWGHKSGPNFQFFRILNLAQQLHEEEWILQLELDTFPVRKVNPDDIPWVYQKEGPWVVGAKPAASMVRGLSPSTRDHINGAAFYRVGEERFQSRLLVTWALSLLDLLRGRPGIAYDVVNSPLVWGRVARDLRYRWKNSESVFSSSSKMTIRDKYLSSRENSEADSHSSTWFVHSLGPHLESDSESITTNP